MPEPTPMPPPTAPSDVDRLVAEFLDGTLPRGAWTHPAHLFVCEHLLRTASPDDVLAELRERIPAHNQRVGEAPHGGYHETITRYFVEAVSAAGPWTTGELLSDPTCQRDAPLRHWSPDVLGSAEARRTWVPTDREALPWSTAT